jgi:hypothetical protein
VSEIQNSKQNYFGHLGLVVRNYLGFVNWDLEFEITKESIIG